MINHFNIPVFDLFPFNTYVNNDLSIIPKSNKDSFNKISLLDNKLGNMWYTINGDSDRYFISYISYDSTSVYFELEYRNNVLNIYFSDSSYKISNTVYTWEEVEKLRLNILMGTENDTKDYYKKITSASLIEDISFQINNEYEYRTFTINYLNSVDEIVDTLFEVIPHDKIFNELNDIDINNIYKSKLQIKNYYSSYEDKIIKITSDIIFIEANTIALCERLLKFNKINKLKNKDIFWI